MKVILISDCGDKCKKKKKKWKKHCKRASKVDFTIGPVTQKEKGE